ncbi:MAG: wax ester/triacylglycerol synthase family O-acyltransferase [Deltaproteobacteria bacterium]|nr:wax ester/triacylglycerol synthase family O-acyltransferase [Deltaproteobacteria bacterium]
MTTPSVLWPTRMNPTDALFWFMDKIPEMRSTTGALLLLEHAPPRQRIRAAFERICENLPRMRQRVVAVPLALAPPEWVDDPQFDLDYHVRYVAVPAPGSLDNLLAEVSPLYATALDAERPLWEAYVAEGLLDGRGAVFVKMHHCVTDGVGGSKLFSELLADRAEPDTVPARRPHRARSTTTAALLWRALLYNVDDALENGASVLDALRTAVRHPGDLYSGIQRGVLSAIGMSRELTVKRAESPMHFQRSLSRSLAAFEMKVGEIDAVRGPLRATNNDIILTVVSGAMHRWHTSRGSDVHALRAMVPVNLRGAGDAEAGNRLALLALHLPIGEPNPLRRLRVIQEEMGRVKHDRRATAYPFLARVMTALPLAVAEQVVRQQTRRTNFVCTNVPGPTHTCYLAGEAIERIYVYAPLVGDHPVAIALISYGDVMSVGLDVDPLAMNDLPRFRDALQESYAEILNIGSHGDVKLPRPPRRRHAAS